MSPDRTESDKPRRFRKRGGAKKKKKKQDDIKKEEGDSGNIGYNSQEPDPKYPNFVATGSYAASLDSDTEAYLTQLEEQFNVLVNAENSNGKYYGRSDIDVHNESPVSLLARNALSELAPRLLELSRHNLASRLLETLIPYAGAQASVNALNTMLEAGGRQFSSLATHTCASHLLQTLLVTSLPEAVPSLLPEVIASWQYDILVEVVSSPAGSHVFRAIVALLAGVVVDEPSSARLIDTVAPSMRYFDDGCFPRDDAAKKAVTSLADLLLEQPDRLPNFLFAPHPCAALQSLLTALAVLDPPTCNKLVEHAFNTSAFHILVTHKCASRFVDRAILTCGSVFPVISKGFADDDTLVSYARHPIANFCTQRYLASLTRRADIARVSRVLEAFVSGELLHIGSARQGVVLALLRAAEYCGDANSRSLLARAVARGVGAVGACARHLVSWLVLRQESLAKAWCSRLDEFGVAGLLVAHHGGSAPPVLRLPASLPRPSHLGTLIARTLMRFPGGGGQSARDSMASLSTVQLIALCADATGCRLVEQWVMGCASPGGVDTNRVEKVAMKVLGALGGDENDGASAGSDGLLAAVCRNPSAGMVVVRCVGRASVSVRRKVLHMLAGLVNVLEGDRFGEVVIRKCRVRQFVKRNDMWEQTETGRERKQRLFSDILEVGSDDEGESKGDGNDNSNSNDHGDSGKHSLKSKTKRKRDESDKSASKKKKKKRDRHENTRDNDGDACDLSAVTSAIKAASQLKT